MAASSRELSSLKTEKAPSPTWEIWLTCHALRRAEISGMWVMPKLEDLALVWDEVYTENSNEYTWLNTQNEAGESLCIQI